MCICISQCVRVSACVHDREKEHSMLKNQCLRAQVTGSALYICTFVAFENLF